VYFCSIPVIIESFRLVDPFKELRLVHKLLLFGQFYSMQAFQLPKINPKFIPAEIHVSCDNMSLELLRRPVLSAAPIDSAKIKCVKFLSTICCSFEESSSTLSLLEGSFNVSSFNITASSKRLVSSEFVRVHLLYSTRPVVPHIQTSRALPQTYAAPNL
jgi:hypothetical protein